MLEGWDGVRWEQAAKIAYPKLRAATADGAVFAPLASCLVTSDRALIVGWFGPKSRNGLEAAARVFESVSVPETLSGDATMRSITKREVVGLLLLSLSTFVAAESLEDATLWPAVRKAIVSDGMDALIGPAGLTAAAREAIDAATKRFGLPRAPADGDTQRHYQTVRFNTGASRAELPLLAQWFRAPLGAPRWFQRWREGHAGFDELLRALDRSPQAALTYLSKAKALFPLLACTVESFRPAPNAGSRAEVPAGVAPAMEGQAPLPLRLVWTDGFPELVLDLERWTPTADSDVHEVACGEAFARRFGRFWNGAFEHRWLSLDLAAAPVVEVDDETFTLPVGGGSPLFFDDAGAPLPSLTGAHAVVAWTRLRSTGTAPYWSQKHGVSVALLDGQVTTEDGETLTPRMPASELGPLPSAGVPRVVEVAGSPGLLRVRVAAASPDQVLLRAWVGDVPLEGSGQGHEVMFSGAVPAVVRGGYLRLRVEWRAAQQLHTRTLDVPLPSSALVVDGDWRAVGGVVEARALRTARISYAIGGLGGEGPSPDADELRLACGRALLALRDRPRPMDVWGLGEPLLLVRRSPHAGGVVEAVASEVVDHGHVIAVPLAQEAPSLTLIESSWATDAWAMVWERDGSCSAVPLSAAHGDRFVVGEKLTIPSRLPRPRAIAFCSRTIWKGAAWADDWQEGLDKLATTEVDLRQLVTTLLSLRVPVLGDPQVSRLLRKHPLAALQWASGDDLGDEASLDHGVAARQLRSPTHAREVLRELCLDLRLGNGSAAPFIKRLPVDQQPRGFQRVISWLLLAGPLPAVEFVRRDVSRANLVRAVLSHRDWDSLKSDAALCRRVLKKDLGLWTDRAREALALPTSSGRFTELGDEAREWLDGTPDELPLTPALRSAFRPEAMSRHVANQQIVRLTEKAKS